MTLLVGRSAFANMTKRSFDIFVYWGAESVHGFERDANGCQNTAIHSKRRQRRPAPCTLVVRRVAFGTRRSPPSTPDQMWPQRDDHL